MTAFHIVMSRRMSARWIAAFFLHQRGARVVVTFGRIGHRGWSTLIGESYPPPSRCHRWFLPIPDKDTRAVELAILVGMYTPRRRSAAWLLVAEKHES